MWDEASRGQVLQVEPFRPWEEQAAQDCGLSNTPTMQACAGWPCRGGAEAAGGWAPCSAVGALACQQHARPGSTRPSPPLPPQSLSAQMVRLQGELFNLRMHAFHRVNEVLK